MAPPPPTSQAEAHYKGNKHARMVKVLESDKSKQKGPATRDHTKPTIALTTGTSPSAFTEKNINTTAVGVETISAVVCPESLPPQPQPSSSLTSSAGRTLPAVSPPPGVPALGPVIASHAAIANSQSVEKTTKQLLHCPLCKVSVNSLSQLQAHNSGTKHKTMVEARNGSGPIKAYPKPDAKPHGQTRPGSGLQDRIFHCQLCDVCVNSELQLKQHISSRRHKDRVAGKSPKPKFSPYNKELRNGPAPTMLLPLQNEFQESVAARFLPNHVAAAMTTVSPSLSLRPAAATSIFQAPPMVHALLRPAPGPIRTSHGPILFTPY